MTVQTAWFPQGHFMTSVIIMSAVPGLALQFFCVSGQTLGGVTLNVVNWLFNIMFEWEGLIWSQV